MLRGFRYIDLDKLVAILATFYLFMSIIPFPMWIIPRSPVYFFSIFSLFSLAIILGLEKRLVFNTYTAILFLVFSLFLTYHTLPMFGHPLDWQNFVRFLPLTAILFFPNTIHYLIFRYFRIIIIVSSVAGTIIFFILLTGIDLPYYKVDAFTVPMLRNNDYYRIYGLVVSSTNTVYDLFGLTIARVCGPFLEPGHFGIYIGTILAIEKVLYDKISKWPIVAGFLTFSPAFIIILMIIVFYDIIYSRRFTLLLGISVVVAIVWGVVITDEKVRDTIYFLSIGRNLNDIEGALLNERSGDIALGGYEKFAKTPKLYTGLGVNYVNERYGVLSDYRGYIFRLGLIGFSLSVLLSIVILAKANNKMLFMLVPIVVLIYAHRFWMFTAPFFYLFMIVGIGSVLMKKDKSELFSIKKN